jgi:hypothetical protein
MRGNTDIFICVFSYPCLQHKKQLMITTEQLQTVGLILLASMLVGLTLAALILWIAARQLRRIHIPTGADFTETMRHTPLLVVLGVDLLDLSLDFLSAPIAWVILDRLGLKALRGISVVQAAVPGTQILPLMTLTWIAVRLFVPGNKTID